MNTNHNPAPAEHWDTPDADGTLRRTYRTSGHRCPLCKEPLPGLEDAWLLSGWSMNTAVTCEYGCGADFEIANPDPLELTLTAAPDGPA